MKGLVASALALARTRLQILGKEVEEELARVYYAAIGAVVAALLAALGAAFGALALVMALGEEHRALAAGLVGGAFLALAAAALWGMRRMTRDRPRLFALSVQELDLDMLVARSAAQRSELAAAGSVLAGVRQALTWAATLAPLYALLKRKEAR